MPDLRALTMHLIPSGDDRRRFARAVLTGATFAAVAVPLSGQQGSVAGAAAVALPTEAVDGDSGPAEVRHRRVQLGTGVELDVAEAGAADGEPVLFLHGYTDSWFSFSPVLERLPSGIRAIVPTQRGHGRSDRPACCYEMSDLAADAVALLDALDIERAVVVGHSMGAFVAQRIAADHPGRVAKLVLVGSGARPINDVLRELDRMVSTLEDPIDAQFARDFQASTARHPLAPEFLERVSAESLQLSARLWRAVLAGMLGADGQVELGRIRTPTLIISGDSDAIFARSEQQELAAAIPAARMLMYEDTGHTPHWERPDRFVEDLFAFVRERGDR